MTEKGKQQGGRDQFF